MASISGWATMVAIALAALLPIAQRIRFGRRAELASRSVGIHVVLGLTAAALGFLHPMTALFALGSPGAIGSGVLGLGLGGVAFVLLLSHAGIGLKLRDPKLKRRKSSRKRHLITAIAVTVAGLAHAAACLLSGSPP